jgi:serine-type D-Ala-D-Ala carboxypeptidase
VTTETLFPLSSLTKPITAALALLLVEDGLLGLNRPVAEYAPEFAGESKEAVMIHHLLTHTSGMNEGEVEKQAREKAGDRAASVYANVSTDIRGQQAIEECLAARWELPLSKPPGEMMQYSDYNYNLLGEILRRVSGRSLDELARERLFDPLGMKDASYILPDERRGRHVHRPTDWPSAGYERAEALVTPWGEGGVSCTALDMAVFGQMLLNGGRYGGKRILSPAAVAGIMRDQIPGTSAQLGSWTFPEAGWTYGWFIRQNKRWAGTLCSPSSLEQGGFGCVYAWVDPAAEVVGVYCSVVPPAELPRHYTHAGRFGDMVTAAVVE